MSKTAEYINELKSLKSSWALWWMLGHQDIKLEYRRSSLGPLWTTLSMAITLCAMGILYGHLLKLRPHFYIPHIATGFIAWSFITKLMNDSSRVFIKSEGFIKDRETNLSPFMMRAILKNLLVFFHTFIVFIPVIFIFNLSVGINSLLIIPGLMLTIVNAIFWGTSLGILCTRYRDLPQIVASMTQIIFFLTPVIWTPSMLSEKMRFVVDYNPFNQFLLLVRNPMTNLPISFHTLSFTLMITALGFGVYATLMEKYKYRVPFWL